MDRNSFYDSLANYSKNSLHSNGINLHDSSKIDFYNSLQHHGIKGQKWGVRRYQNTDGSLTDEGKQRYLNPDGTLNAEGQKKLGREGVAKFNQQRQQQQNNNTGNVYDEETQKNKLNNAKQNKMYDKLFVETIQNADLSDDEINKEYEAYLKDPKKYSETFETNSLGKIKNSLSGNNTSKVKEQVSKFTKEEKKEIKDAKKEAWKTATKKHGFRNLVGGPLLLGTLTKKHGLRNLVGGRLLGTLSDWGMVNKAIKELGYTSEEKKNLTASDWNKINEKIADMRGFNK